MPWDPREAEEEAAYDEMVRSIIEESRDEIVWEFIQDRLRSYYKANPTVALPASRALRKAQDMLRTDPSAALVFAFTSIEITVRQALLRGIVNGLVHSAATAEFVVTLIAGQRGLDRVRPLIAKFLSEHTNLNLEQLKRVGASRTLWEEVSAVQKDRNAIVHSAEWKGQNEADVAIRVAEAILEELYKPVVESFGFKVAGVDYDLIDTGPPRIT